MFPWLAFGHLIPSLELAKLIAQKGHHISFVSTPRNIECLPKLSPNLVSFIKFVKLALPKVDNLPENVEATIDVPYDVVQYLKKAYDDLEEPLTCFLKSSKVDWHFYDPYMLQLPKRFKEKTKWCGIVSPDHGLNSRVLEVKKMGYSIPKDEQDGSFTSDAVANLISTRFLKAIHLVICFHEHKVRDHHKIQTQTTHME
ncbi:UDP-glycosyltransferase 91A1 [Glycine soja]|uniref:UDP-glycosyltransferase 91A1 n=1 Tax=Glycine soja TaxID=3848 RepID=A0A445JL56_GLYSO|nr:UDP-glycosyltransferase 91A1 [Glycine soja]